MPYWETGVGWLLALVPVLAFVIIGSALRQNHLRHRRGRSLRRDDAGLYVWIDIDGRERSSRDDPRPGWDAAHADGSRDGDGGGGD